MHLPNKFLLAHQKSNVTFCAMGRQNLINQRTDLFPQHLKCYVHSETPEQSLSSEYLCIIAYIKYKNASSIKQLLVSLDIFYQCNLKCTLNYIMTLIHSVCMCVLQGIFLWVTEVRRPQQRRRKKT